ncbi:alpha-hydroxy acid oxidase [Elioraea rosea]|uniref:alpha-hydroxy acid oxidase n=1 Tax=Elioraea rosea TaxID=2492390 RepID=UPI001315844F|nr:alpha-hydroxy acid oxidase [Elioraea rosea]
MRLDEAHSIADLERAARRRLPRFVYDFIAGGAGQERTLSANRAAFERRSLVPRVLGGASPTPAVDLLGKTARLPLAIAPIGLAGLFHPDGEIGLARAAARAGIPFCLSTNSVASIEEVSRAVPDGRLWFQLYPLRDREMMTGLLLRAADAGAEALVLTADLAAQGRRLRDLRNGFAVPPRLGARVLLDLAAHPGWSIAALRGPRIGFGNLARTREEGAISIARHVATVFDAEFSWDDAARLREAWPGRFAIKGILHPEDALRAVSIGADAVMVSNHGGRQLDMAIAAIDAVPPIAASVGPATTLMMDGGVRHGSEVLVAQSLGARACLVGRAVIWGLAAAGQAGAERALGILGEEIANGLALLGTTGDTDGQQMLELRDD